MLNETGFRKALKKFDKYTKNASRELYMSEKVNTSRAPERAASDSFV